MENARGHVHLADGSVAETVAGRVWLDNDGKPIQPTALHQRIGDLELEIRQNTSPMEIALLRQRQHNLLHQLMREKTNAGEESGKTVDCGGTGRHSSTKEVYECPTCRKMPGAVPVDCALTFGSPKERKEAEDAIRKAAE